jgi:hypothetical protein
MACGLQRCRSGQLDVVRGHGPGFADLRWCLAGAEVPPACGGAWPRRKSRRLAVEPGRDANPAGLQWQPATGVPRCGCGHTMRTEEGVRDVGAR